MKSYIISYDLNKPGQNYNNLYEGIKNTGRWWHCLDSTWIVATEKTAEQIRDYLKRFIDGNDRLFVGKVIPDAAWTGFSKNCSDWLKENL